MTESYSRQQIYRLLEAVYAPPVLPDNPFSAECYEMLGSFCQSIEQGLALHYAVPQRALDNYITCAQRDALASIYFPDQGPVDDDALGEAVVENNLALINSGFCQYLHSKGIIFLDPSGSDMPLFDHVAYIHQRDALQQDYLELAGKEAHAEFELFDRLTQHRLLAEQSVVIEQAIEDLKTESLLLAHEKKAPIFLSRHQMRELKDKVGNMDRAGDSVFDDTLCGPANEYQQEVLHAFTNPLFNSRDFETFEQSQFHRLTQRIYGEGTSDRVLVAKIEADREHMQHSPYIRFLEEQSLIQPNGIVGFPKTEEGMKKLNKAFFAYCDQNDLDGEDCLARFTRFAQYEQLCCLHTDVHMNVAAAISDIAHEQQRGMG